MINKRSHFKLFNNVGTLKCIKLLNQKLFILFLFLVYYLIVQVPFKTHFIIQVFNLELIMTHAVLDQWYYIIQFKSQQELFLTLFQLILMDISHLVIQQVLQLVQTS